MTDTAYKALKDKIRNDAIAGLTLQKEYAAAVNSNLDSYEWAQFESAVNIEAWKIAYGRKLTPEEFRENNEMFSPFNKIPDYWNTH